MLDYLRQAVSEPRPCHFSAGLILPSVHTLGARTIDFAKLAEGQQLKHHRAALPSNYVQKAAQILPGRPGLRRFGRAAARGSET